MTSKILIVDDIATNRIVMKVKLASAHYDVQIAKSGAAALDLLTQDTPDLVVASAELQDFPGALFVQAFRSLPDLNTCPLVLISGSGASPDQASAARLAALRSGADEVFVKPVPERLLLAKIRSLLRSGQGEENLQLHAVTRHALGFAEQPAGFDRPGCVALISQDLPQATKLCATLKPHTRHKLYPVDFDDMLTGKKHPLPDAIVLDLRQSADEEGLRHVAELRSAAHIRQAPILTLMSDEQSRLAPTILDIGAKDFMFGNVEMAELALRVSSLIRQKKAGDQMRDRLENGLKAAVIDPLTGLYNRRYALPYLEHLCHAALKDGHAFGLMIADIDHFKTVNDTYGHIMGDRVLETVANALRSTVRSDDMVARIGGEEFLIVLPDCSWPDLREQAQRICRTIDQMPLAHLGAPGPEQVTVSIGATRFSPGSDTPTTSPEALLAQADNALYIAKADGRNTISYSERCAA